MCRRNVPHDERRELLREGFDRALTTGTTPTLVYFYQPARRVKTLLRGTFLGRLCTLLRMAILTIVPQKKLQSPGKTSEPQAKKSRQKVTFRDIFRLKKKQIFQPSRMGHDQAGTGRPHLARPVIHLSHGPEPDPAYGIPISQTVGQARSARFHLSRRPSARPGL